MAEQGAANNTRQKQPSRPEPGGDTCHDALDYAEAIIATVREPLLVLDGDLRVRTANPSFCRTFRVRPEETEGRLLYDLGDGQWDIPALRKLLGDILTQNTFFEGFEVRHDSPDIGRRVMLLNARRLHREGNHAGLILLAIEDVTRLDAEEARGEAAQLHFQALFESSPGLFLVLKPDLTIVAVSDAYLSATLTRREDIVGRGLFEVFPDNPNDPAATGVRNLRASLDRVLRHKTADAMAVQKYDIRRPETEGGGFEERYWSPVNSPVLGPGGEVEYIIHRVEDVTAFVRQKQAGTPGIPDAAALRTRNEQMEAEIFLRGQQLQQLNEQLRAANEALAAEIGQRREADERFRLMVEGVQDYAIFMLDPEGRVASWNAGARRIKAYEAQEIIGQHFSKFYPQEALDRGWPAEELRRAAAEGRIEDEGWRVRKDGSLFWANVVITALKDRDGRLRGFSKVTRDLTERRRLEQQLREHAAELEQRAGQLQDAKASLEATVEALRESEERFRTMVEGVKDYAIFRLDPQGRVVTWNTGAERIKGYRAEEIIGQHFSRFYQPADRERGRPERGLRLAVKEGRYEDEGWRVRKDGSLFLADVVITPLFDRQGRLAGFTKVTRDITGRKELERQLQGHAAELEHRTRELQEANAALQAFGYSVSHDLRAPLRNMQSLAQALEEDYADRLDEEGQVYCHRITAAARKMDTLINDLLAYSRLSRSDLPLARVDLDEVLVEARSTLATVIGERQAQVTVEGPLPAVFGHRTTLVQIVQNLLGNALKFVAPGVQPKVRVWAEGRDRFVRLWVEDNGIGIAPAHQQRIFNVFERLHGEESYPGTGIGLAIVKKGVERTGGQVGVESQVGRGSRFWVDLPQRGETT